MKSSNILKHPNLHKFIDIKDQHSFQNISHITLPIFRSPTGLPELIHV